MQQQLFFNICSFNMIRFELNVRLKMWKHKGTDVTCVLHCIEIHTSYVRRVQTYFCIAYPSDISGPQ
jgi:hypothetical protein